MTRTRNRDGRDPGYQAVVHPVEGAEAARLRLARLIGLLLAGRWLRARQRPGSEAGDHRA